MLFAFNKYAFNVLNALTDITSVTFISHFNTSKVDSCLYRQVARMVVPRGTFKGSFFQS